MRDPDASIRFDGPVVVRTLYQPIGPDHFLNSALCREWVSSGKLLPHVVVSPTRIEAARLPFVSHPYEWCDSQIYAAARLSFSLAQEAIEAGFDLKDASAWNVLFVGGRPAFCDLLSVDRLKQRNWWAAGQFARHFILPLLLSRQRGLSGHQSFQIWRDGVPPIAASRMLGWRRFVGPYWPLMASPIAEGKADATPSATHSPDQPLLPADLASTQVFRRSLFASLSLMLKGVAPRPVGARTSAGQWVGYHNDRAHYPGDSIALKRATAARWLAATAPRWVVDLGCNEGEFSRLALDCGAHVIAIDSDHDCIDNMFRQQAGSDRLHAVIAQIDDLTAGRGWAGSEFEGLPARLAGCADLVLMLALLHHLAIGAAVPLDAVACFAAAITSEHLIVEWIDETDPQLRLLCAQRRRDPADFSMARQRDAFLRAGMVIEAEVSLLPAARTLALMKRGQAAVGRRGA